MGGRLAVPLHLVFLLFLSNLSVSFAAGDSINQTQAIRDDGGGTLVSANGRFVLGFFSPGVSQYRYVGIWYSFANQTVVWVANRQNPISDHSGVLNLTGDGAIALYQSSNGRLVWSWVATRNVTRADVLLRLLNSGNLVIVDAKSGSGSTAPSWQSFDNPTDTLLPTMKMGLDFRNGRNISVTSWKSPDDPSPGDHVCGFASLDHGGIYDIYVLSTTAKTGWDRIEFRFGPWNGVRFSGIPRMSSYIAGMFKFRFVSDAHEASYSFDVISSDIISRLVMNPEGTFERLLWSSATKEWTSYWSAPKDDCDAYAKCGPNGICSYENPGLCQCYPGFQPRSLSSWQLRDFRSGCQRKEALNCSTGSDGLGFLPVTGVKLPETSYATRNTTASMDTCRDECFNNCSCAAYAANDISNGTGIGCLMWFGDLIDTRMFTVDGQDLYLKVPSSELDKLHRDEKRKAIRVSTIVLIIILIPLTALVAHFFWRRRRNMSCSTEGSRLSRHLQDSTQIEVTIYDFSEISSATGNFCFENKIGQGGFGSVYKGVLVDGQEVAVKRLSRITEDTGQGPHEFMIEANLIAKLQHRNLVRLLGCCIEREERILVYEFMRNKSLDTFLFDKSKSSMLDWNKRWEIILGVARGLVYLHRDSRLRVVHRDLKAANVLLDELMNPKISDFGTARIFANNQMQDITSRVIGTYGYMSPEYAMEGIISLKSDVFSFGVLSLEIVSGIKNRVGKLEEQGKNLLELAWTLWRDGDGLQLLDKTMDSVYSNSQVIQIIHVSLLCVQEDPADRPTMSSVVSMLENDTTNLQVPNRPWTAKFKGVLTTATQSSTDRASVNNLTHTKFEGR